MITPPHDSVGRDHLVGHIPPPRRSLFRPVGGKSHPPPSAFPALSLPRRGNALTLLIFVSPPHTTLQAKGEDVAPLTEVEHLLVVAGNSDEENPYRKGSAIQVRVDPLGTRGRKEG